MLLFIASYFGEHQSVPAYREIGEAVGISSPNGVMSQLESLAEKGYLRMRKNKGRSHHRGYALTDLALPVKLIADRFADDIHRGTV